jgi:hypothetical protein
MHYDSEILIDYQMKLNKLRDDPHIDIDSRVRMWQETFHVRRKSIRDRSTSEILEEYPGYTDPILVGLSVVYFIICIE